MSRVQKYFIKIKQISAIIILSIAIFNQTEAAVEKGINISGTLFNAVNREPVQTMIIFLDEAGEEIKAISENNGQYQASLIPGKKYSIAVENNVIVNEDEEFVQIQKNSIGEVRKNFELAKILPGVELLASNAFGANKEVLNADALTHILMLKTFLKINKNAKIKIFVSAEDTYISDKSSSETNEPKAKKAKKQRKSKKETDNISDGRLSAQERINKLVSRRASNLRDIFTSLRISEDRYSVEEIAIAAEKPLKPTQNIKKPKKETSIKMPEVADSGMKLITLKVEIAK